MTWSVFKQKVRETIGTAQVTSFPAEVENQIRFVESSKSHVTAINEAIADMIEPWNTKRLNKPEGIADTTGTMGSRIEDMDAGKIMLACSESHKYIGKLERKAQEDIRRFVHKEFYQAWVNVDYRRLVAHAKELKEARLNYDARKTDYQKKQTEERELKMKKAQAEFDKVADETATAFASLTTMQKGQIETMKQFMRRLKDHYNQCYNSLKTTLQKLEE